MAVAAIVLLLLSACRTSRHTTERLKSVHLDSQRTVSSCLDSAYIRDSTNIYSRHDTVIIYHEVTRHHVTSNRDTVYIAKFDTVYISHSDTIYVNTMSDNVRHLSWYETLCLNVGRLCCIAVLLYAVFLYLKRKQ